MCVQIILSSVDDWLPFGKETITQLSVCSLCIMSANKLVDVCFKYM